ncbi:hypothetical protein HKD37_05G012863 [Glycine soja]
MLKKKNKIRNRKIISCSRTSSSCWTSLNENSFLRMCLIFDKVGKVYVVKWNDVLDVDKDGNYHNVVYNKDLDQPAIVVGWTALRDFYQLTGNHLVSLHHYVAYQDHSQDDTLYTIKCQVLSPSKFISLSRKTFQVTCIIFLKTKVGRICTWRTLQNVGSCVFNHYRKTLKIGAGWKHFYETLSLTADMEIVFEFIDPNVNRVLYWSSL